MRTAFENEGPLNIDETGWRILNELQEDARLSMAELGRKVGLSAPAVTERVRRLESAGVITGYAAQVDLARVGRPLLAYIRISAANQVKEKVAKVVRDMPEVLECHRGTGGDCFIIKVAVAGIPHLERVSDAFTGFGRLTTTIVLSTVLGYRQVEQVYGE